MNFMQGTLDLLILTALADGPLHGYDVVEWIRTATNGALEIDDGALYTSLHRMEKRGWLDHEWRVSPKGRRAKYLPTDASRAGQTAGRRARLAPVRHCCVQGVRGASAGVTWIRVRRKTTTWLRPLMPSWSSTSRRSSRP